MTDERGYAKGRARRAEILETAMGVFGEIGYRGASLRDIASRCGISHPGLKHHFPTKEALLMAVLEWRDESAEAVTLASGATGAQSLAQVVGLVASNADSPHIVELFATLSAEATAADHPAHAFFADRYRAVVGQLTAVYRQAWQEGTLRAGIDPQVAARELVALMDGLQLQWLYDRDGIDMAGAVAAHVRSQLVNPPPGL